MLLAPAGTPRPVVDKLNSALRAALTDANVRARIDEGGNGMPAYKDMLADTEKDDLIAYLKTL